MGFDLTVKVRAAVLECLQGHGFPLSDKTVRIEMGPMSVTSPAWISPAGPRERGRSARVTRPHPGAQRSFTDINGFHFQVFITDQDDPDIAHLEARPPGPFATARTPGCGAAVSRVRRECGLARVGSHRPGSSGVDAETLSHRGGPRHWEPKRVRYRLLHISGRLARSGRRLTLRLQSSWPWVNELLSAFLRLRALPSAR